MLGQLTRTSLNMMGKRCISRSAPRFSGDGHHPHYVFNDDSFNNKNVGTEKRKREKEDVDDNDDCK